MAIPSIPGGVGAAAGGAELALGLGNIAQGMAINQILTQAQMAAATQKKANEIAANAI
ncbi:hypothetical protein [Janthinobacterium agaricidamnosum]|uniref:Uncharacterized protein n=1 Tax=Janthinobacterium agaricidamnosum NBRC 102515 = DSM 9628 TaxID=1349767 RepID=W0V4K0_9BURK|nr:hypothetical protein [Janthinobacterium agaricidamnosum]CDG82283.1 hypothetical protein GJA_1645 [Janthinobacterium agaricidamnosum NBRC 102515 = DSM 9628]